MNLEQQVQIIDTIHNTLDGYVGQRLKVKASMGRSKIVVNEGVLMQTHPQLFVMEVDRKRDRKARQSYQYVDVLTGVVELTQNGEPIFDRQDIDPTLEDEMEDGFELLGDNDDEGEQKILL